MTTLDRDRSRAGWLRPTARGLTPALAEHGASPKRSEAGSTAPTVAFRMDEAAPLLHPVAPVRVGLDILGGLLAMLILPGPTCVAWVAGGLTVEIWGWFATRAQARGQAVKWPARANFVANYVSMNLWWLLLGVLFWRT